MPQLVVRIALRTLDFEKPFPTDPWKINNLTQTVDQEVGGSNPPSCTSKINGLGKPGAWPLLFEIIFGRTFFCTEIITQFISRIWNTVL